MDVEFVPYDRALKLKELGFDKECFAWYVSAWYVNESYGLEYGKVVKSDLIKDGIVAPTFSQAFRWFRDQGFLIHFSSHDVNTHDFYIKWSPEKSILSDVYDTYEESELSCLDKLVEIAESEKQDEVSCNCVGGIIMCPGCDGKKESEFGECAGCNGEGIVTCGKCGGKKIFNN